MSSVNPEQEKCLLDGSSQCTEALVEVQTTSPHPAEDTCASEGVFLPISTIQELVAPCSKDINTTELGSLSDNVVATEDVTGSAAATCGDVNVVDSSLMRMSATSGSLDPPMSTHLVENQELAMLSCLESILLERRLQGKISREEHVSVSTMISMSKFVFSDMGKFAASWRKLDIPSFEIQYEGILNAMKLDRLPPLPSDTKVMPVTTEFTSSATSKEEADCSDISEPDTIESLTHDQTQVVSSAKLLASVNLNSNSPTEDTSNV